MRALAGYNYVNNSITQICGVVNRFADIFWEILGKPEQVSRPAPENSLMFFNVFEAKLLTNP